MVFSKVVGLFSTDMGVDLGTTNSLVCVQGRGILIEEPSVVAVKKGTRNVLLEGDAIGQTAKDMYGRTPGSIEAIRPLKDGIIANCEMTEAMLAYFIRRVHNRQRWFSPRLLLSIPSDATDVERLTVIHSAQRAGAREVYLIEEPRAAGLGSGLPIHTACGHMVIDIGGGTTEIAVISLADIVVSTSFKVAGNAMDEAILNHMKKNYNILIGENTAEQIKVQIGSAIPLKEELSIEVYGRDAIAGLPRSVTVNSVEIRDALRVPIYQIIDRIRNILERTGPELSADLLKRGMTLCGGGVLLRGLDRLIRQETGLPTHFADDPLTAVARGIGMLLENLDEFKEHLQSGEDDL